MAERNSALPRTELDMASAKELDRLLGHEPAAITEAERAWLSGRRDYLTKDEQKDFGVEAKKK